MRLTYEDDHWISVGQAAQRLGMSYPRTANLIYEGRLRAVMIRSRWRVDPDSVERLQQELSQA